MLIHRISTEEIIMTECTNQFGGRVALTVGGVVFRPCDADMKLMTSEISVEGKANHDGSASYVVKPELVGAEITFRYDSGIRWTTQMLLCQVNATFVEEDNGRTHLFSNVRFTGKPDINLTNGEVTGVKVEGGRGSYTLATQ
jgi:Phage tail tube protein